MSYVGSPSGVQGYAGKGSGPRAGFGRRLGGFLLDWIVLALINVILVAALKTAGELIGAVVEFTYLTVLIGGPRGQTLGQQAMGIRVVSFDTGGSIGYGRAFARIFAAWLSAVVIFLGFFWMIWDKERQCWHDKLIGDVVVPIDAYPLP
jgi:uncharacterized RDD family membrane protein YckC